MDNPMILERLRKSMTDLTQEELAEKLGMSKNTYRRIITGENSPNTSYIKAAAKFFNVTEQELLTGSIAVLDEPLVEYEPKRTVTQIIVNLDGTSKNLRNWVKRLEAINSAL